MSEHENTSSYAYGAGATRLAVVFWDGGGSSVPLSAPGQVTIGRAEDSGIRIDHGSVSRMHARLHVEEEGVEIEDLGSSNGTRVNAQRLTPHQRVALCQGDVVEVGAAMLVVQHRAQGPEAAAPKRTQGDPMAPLARLVALVAQGSLPVILIGETGVGKDVWARRIHELSAHASSPFVAINCAAIPEPLLESELFGHEKGAFTGADKARIGLLETAGDGTVFLDEISELPGRLQAKLLRALENQEIYPLGGSRPRHVRARFVSATNRNIEALVASGGFRADLYFRLNGITLRIPSLRERPHDIEALAVEFVGCAARSLGRPEPRIAPAALAWLKTQPWPGNIRELKNRIECACLLCGGGPIEINHLAPDAGAEANPSAPRSPCLWSEFESIERRRILEALESCDGNQTRAAARLGISRRTLINRLDDYGVERPRKR